MSLFVLSDTHLSFSDNKPMDVFGRRWQDYTHKLEKNWNSIVSDEDTVVIAGDISWAMSHIGAVKDFEFLDKLKGTKIIGKGNHDYWWTSLKKLNEMLSLNKFDSIKFLYNNAYLVDGRIIAGSRGWYYDENNKNAPENADFEKIVAREVIRLELSLAEAEKIKSESAPDAEIIVFLHFPPVYGSFECEQITDVLKKHGIKRCYFGHIHSAYDVPRSFEQDGITYYITSADFLEFTPLKIF